MIKRIIKDIVILIPGGIIAVFFAAGVFRCAGYSCRGFADLFWYGLVVGCLLFLANVISDLIEGRY